LSSQYGNISSTDLEKLDKMIPEKFVAEYFVNDLDAMSSRYGMKINKIDINVPASISAAADENQQNTGRFSTITGKFTLSGRYDQFLSFLKDLESSLRLIDVVSVNIVSSQNQSKPGQERISSDILNYSVEIHTYSIK
ncbi:MAG: hypothetical protein WAW92_04445, partial [Minisyncoccia bacterium]